MTKNIDAHILKQFTVGKLMGSGAYGHVWKVESKVDGRRYALKKVFGAFRNSVDAQRTYRQVQILKQLKHAYIIKLERVIRAANKQDLYLLFELMEADLLSVVGNSILSIGHQKYLLFQLLKAISYLHDLKLIHRDLKPSNILLDSNCTLKICDFGLVRSLSSAESENNILSQEVATKWYRAPQLLLGSRSYSFPIDVWSIGCIAAELLTGKALFTGKSTLEQLEKILQYSGKIAHQDLQSLDSPVAECLISQIHPKKKIFADYFSLIDPLFYPLLQATLQFNPNKRLTAKQCLQLEMFKQFAEHNSETQKQQIQKGVSLSLDDNMRFRVKDYRSLIYESLLKRKHTSEAHKNHRYKSLTRVIQKQIPAQNGHLKDTKAKSSSYLIKKRVVGSSNDNKCKLNPYKRRQMRQKQASSPNLRSLSKDKNGSPYQKRANQIALLLKNKSRALININSQKCIHSKLKKVSKLVKYDKSYKK